MTGCCVSPNLVWTPYGNLPEPIITCTHCGFRIDPDGVLLDWLDPEEIQAARILEENMPRILELAARLGLIEAAEDNAGRVYQPQPEDVLSTSEAELLQRADQEKLPCPRCERPLSGQKLITAGVYEGVVLICSGCGFREA